MQTHPASFAQHGEDLLLIQFFEKKNGGFFVEIGANDPEQLSQTLLLEQKGWKGILVEPQSKFYEKLCRLRPASRVYQVACGAPEQRGTAVLHIPQDERLSSLVSKDATDLPAVETEEVKVVTLNEILEKDGCPKIDFV